MTSSLPSEVLEQRAADQRRQIHNSVTELRFALRERLDLRRNTREHLLPAAGAAALLGLLFGYGLTGMFTRR